MQNKKFNGYEAIRQNVDDGNTSVKTVAREPNKAEYEKKVSVLVRNFICFLYKISKRRCWSLVIPAGSPQHMQFPLILQVHYITGQQV